MKGYFLPADALNEPMRESLEKLIERAKLGHHTDARLRIEGEYEWYQADWIKHIEVTQ